MGQVFILDFGSQYTQLIARRVRELKVFCEIIPYYSATEAILTGAKAVIFSGSPASVNQPDAPTVAPKLAAWLHSSDRCPILGICYGIQWLVRYFGGDVTASDKREYGKAEIQKVISANSTLIEVLPAKSVCWMSHSDTISQLPKNWKVTAFTESIPVAACENSELKIYGFQFHPEVVHTAFGKAVLRQFLFEICKVKANWTPAHFIKESIRQIQSQIGEAEAICALSGGVDSTVAATLVHRAIGKRQHCVFVNTGLLRKNEFDEVLASYHDLGLNLVSIDASNRFLAALRGVTDPEEKRKIIGRLFIEIFEETAKKISPDIQYLVQGTIYPDVIESVSVSGPSATIKSHHNVGGLPEKLGLKLIEPLKMLFKDEVRHSGKKLQIPQGILGRHPFPGPGLAIRIPGEVTKEKIALLQEADAVFIESLRQFGWYHRIWQAFAVLLPVKTVGVMGDERTYESAVALRAVESTDGMTANRSPIPHKILAEIANRIINRVKGINRVVYDISSKPPSTIEWE
jgi:GMP synthase (glutamine-hydrolysing)